MPKYIFTFDERDNSFPERYRVVALDEDAAFLRDTESLTGTVLYTEATDFLEELMARYQSNEAVRVEFVDAPHWEFIEARFRPAEAERAAKESDKPPGGGFVR